MYMNHKGDLQCNYFITCPWNLRGRHTRILQCNRILDRYGCPCLAINQAHKAVLKYINFNVPLHFYCKSLYTVKCIRNMQDQPHKYTMNIIAIPLNNCLLETWANNSTQIQSALICYISTCSSKRNGLYVKQDHYQAAHMSVLWMCVCMCVCVSVCVCVCVCAHSCSFTHRQRNGANFITFWQAQDKTAVTFSSLSAEHLESLLQVLLLIVESVGLWWSCSAPLLCAEH